MSARAPEFSRAIRVDTLGEAPRAIAIEADAAERAALAKRFALIAIDHLAAEAVLSRGGEDVAANGRLAARVTQSCVATGEPVVAEVAEDFVIVFRPQPIGGAGQDEVELDAAEMDVVFYQGPSVDLGEAVAETLSLALDPFPRAPEAEIALRRAGVKSERQAMAEEEAAKTARSPFAALRKD